jgi:hypothetical protein
MYTYSVPQLTIYVDQKLYNWVKSGPTPVSNICQKALRRYMAQERARVHAGIVAANAPKADVAGGDNNE